MPVAADVATSCAQGYEFGEHTYGIVTFERPKGLSHRARAENCAVVPGERLGDVIAHAPVTSRAADGTETQHLWLMRAVRDVPVDEAVALRYTEPGPYRSPCGGMWQLAESFEHLHGGNRWRDRIARPVFDRGKYPPRPDMLTRGEIERREMGWARWCLRPTSEAWIGFAAVARVPLGWWEGIALSDHRPVSLIGDARMDPRNPIVEIWIYDEADNGGLDDAVLLGRADLEGVPLELDTTVTITLEPDATPEAVLAGESVVESITALHRPSRFGEGRNGCPTADKGIDVRA